LFFSCRNTKKQEIISQSFAESYILYIGTYTEKEAHVDGKAEGIYIYRMDAKTGSLSYLNTSPPTVNPSYLDISNDGKYLYSVNETGGDSNAGRVSAFRIINDYAGLEFINQVSSEGESPCFIEADKNGHFVLTANYGTGNVSLIPVNTDGSLEMPTYTHQHEGKGITTRQESAHAHCIRISPDGNFVYSSDLGTDKVYVYKVTGNTLEQSRFYQATPGSGPRHLAFHPSKYIVYSINELNGTIDCLHRDTISGELKRFQTVSTVSDDKGSQAGSADIHITPSGEFLYATNRGDLNNIAVFRVNNQTGELNLVTYQPVKGNTPRNFAIDPSGTFLLVANQNSDKIVTFRIDPVTGRLAETGIETKIPTPVCIKFLPSHLQL
ncbi:MAG TPA: lactonase family protein, partial [Bacteroidales bacterium]|nr:lactonase family protein [Bacteroidales bacterium]